jgi:Rad3-related DNA helicase
MQRRGETDADEGLGEFDYIILDELHAAESHVAKALHVDLDVSMTRRILGHDPISTSASVEEWREWGRMLRVALASKLDRISRELRLAHEDGGVRRELIDELSTLRGLDRDLSDLGQMYGRWIVERISDSKLSFDPVWTDRYAEKLLFRGIPVVVGMSATVVPATLRYLGIEEGTYDFFEYASPFDIRRRPIYVWPIVRMNYTMSDQAKVKWAEATDSLLAARLDRKVLIPTVSYKRARELQQLSKRAGSFVMHDPKSTKDAVERFRRMSPPAVLVSPSVSTGWDFPDDDVRTIIVAKTPYPSRESAVMQARIASDHTYQDVYAATEFSQTVGRHVRSETDWGETIVTDAAFGGLTGGEKWRNLAKYIRQAITYVKTAPRPLKY